MMDIQISRTFWNLKIMYVPIYTHLLISLYLISNFYYLFFMMGLIDISHKIRHWHVCFEISSNLLFQQPIRWCQLLHVSHYIVRVSKRGQLSHASNAEPVWISWWIVYEIILFGYINVSHLEIKKIYVSFIDLFNCLFWVIKIDLQ